MISEIERRSSERWTQDTDPDDAYREQFSNVLARVGVERGQAVALAEVATGRPFETCSPVDLVPVLELLLEIVHSHRSPALTEEWRA